MAPFTCKGQEGGGRTPSAELDISWILWHIRDRDRLSDQNQHRKHQISFCREAKLSSYPSLPQPIPCKPPHRFKVNLQIPKLARESSTCVQGPGARKRRGHVPGPRPLTDGGKRASTAPARGNPPWLGREKPHVAKWLGSQLRPKRQTSRPVTGLPRQIKAKRS